MCQNMVKILYCVYFPAKNERCPSTPVDSNLVSTKKTSTRRKLKRRMLLKAFFYSLFFSAGIHFNLEKWKVFQILKETQEISDFRGRVPSFLKRRL